MSEAQANFSEVEDTLPDKLFQLLDQALFDLNKAESDPRYQVAMSRWHSLDTETELCCVCLAGSVMAFTLKCPRDKDELSFGASDRLWAKLECLNYIRCGALVTAYRTMAENVDGYDLGEGPMEELVKYEMSLSLVPYATDSEKFKEQMRDIKELFERLYV